MFVMHLLMLFILSILSLTPNVYPQAENNGQILPILQVGSSDDVDPSKDLDGKTPLFSDDDTEDTMENDPTLEFADQPTDLASVDIANQKISKCDISLTTRDESSSLNSISDKP